MGVRELSNVGPGRPGAVLAAAAPAAGDRPGPGPDGRRLRRYEPGPFTSADWLVLAALTAGTLLLALLTVRFSAVPFEDAAMLMRYAAHLAAGHGIVWNVGDAPVDGATDFLFMVAIAGLVKLGVPLEAATRGLILGSHVLTAAILYRTARVHHHTPRLFAGLTVAFFACGSGPWFASSGFGAPFFALWVALTWAVMLPGPAAGAESHSWGRSLAFALSALGIGLTRPEGVFLAGLIVLAAVWRHGWGGARRMVTAFVLVYGVLGGAYFLWRWHYFGHPLPNPFYKKGGGHLYPRSLYNAGRGVLYHLAPFVVILLAAGAVRRARRHLPLVAIPVVPFVLVWILLSDEMNHCSRFQYALVPVVLASWWPAGRGVLLALRSALCRTGGRARPWGGAAARWLGPALAAGLVVAAAGNVFVPRTELRYHSLYDVGLALRPFGEGRYTMAVTEAGLLPLYSRWRAVDTWGLNDAWIAHHGVESAGYFEYLDRQRPHLILNHAFFDPSTERPTADPRDHWSRLNVRVHEYAVSRGYVLAAAYSPDPRQSGFYDFHYFWVRPDFADSGRIIETIRSIPNYRMVGHPYACRDYRDMAGEARTASQRVGAAAGN